MASELEQKFLVLISDGRFLSGVDGNTLDVTEIPSRALHLSYKQADVYCQQIKRRGFRSAIVVNYLGQPVTSIDLQNELREIVAVKNKLPKTYADLDAIPAVEIRKRYRTEPEFVKAYEQIVATPRQPLKPKRV